MKEYQTVLVHRCRFCASPS